MNKIKIYEATSELGNHAKASLTRVREAHHQADEFLRVLRHAEDQLRVAKRRQEYEEKQRLQQLAQEAERAMQAEEQPVQAELREDQLNVPQTDEIRTSEAETNEEISIDAPRKETVQIKENHRVFTVGQNRPSSQTTTQTHGERMPSQNRNFAGNDKGQRPARPFTNNDRGPSQANTKPPFRPSAPRTPNIERIAADLPPAVGKEKVSNYDPKKSTFSRPHTLEKKEKSKKALVNKGVIHLRNQEDEDSARGYRKVHKRRNEQKYVKPEPIVIDHAIVTGETIIIKDLAERIGKPASDIIKKLLLLGIFATINQEIEFDTAQLIASEFGVELELKLDKSFEDALVEEHEEDDAASLIQRPPIVTIMGHVDHGKTSLLDKIRNTHVTQGEAGGITQHIGAYQIELNDRFITFLDTPGHEAFTSMRARGAMVTDVAVLVVSADDGVMPQTIEAIHHAQAAKVPIVVAINKIDKPAADPERVKRELMEHGLVCEEWGGDTVCAPVSAKTGEGIDQLLEMILLVADMQELGANPNRQARGAIIEAQLDKGRGPVATVLVQNGTLRVGDAIVAGIAHGRVRAMMDDLGHRVHEAGPSQPVEVIGFSEVPDAGDVMFVVEDDKLTRQVAQERKDKIKAQRLKAISKVSLEDFFSKIAEGEMKDLILIVKADVQGSVEAVCQSLEKLSNEEVRVRVIHSGVGAIKESDIMLASASGAIIIGFNVRPEAMARAAAEREKVDIRLYRVIYTAIEDVQKAMKGMLAPVFKEVVLGHVSVRNIFKVSDIGTIAGCYVTDGKVLRAAQVRVLRDSVVLFEGKIGSLKRFKDDAKEVASGYECGMSIDNFNDIKVDDVFEIFTQEEVKQD